MTGGSQRWREAFDAFVGMVDCRDDPRVRQIAADAGFRPVVDAAGLTLQFHGFSLTLTRDGKYFITDTSGG